jgi:hypothetical protein
MASAIIDPVTSNTYGGSYNAAWGSIYDLEFEPQVWQEWYNAFGKGFMVFDWLQIPGQTVNVKARNIDAFADQAVERAALLGDGGIPFAGHLAGAVRNFDLAATEYLDADGATTTTPYVRVGDSIFIDPLYTNKDVPTKWQVATVGLYNGGAPTDGTIFPYDATVALTANVPASSYVMVGPHNSGVGGGQPGPRRSGTTSQTFYTAITDETAEIKGGVNAEKLYRNDLDKSGKGLLWTKAQVETEFLHRAGMDKEIFLGQVNSNTANITVTDRDSNAVAARGTKGLWHHVEESGMEQSYAGSYDLAYFDQIKEYLRSQGVTDAQVAILAGSNLFKQIENTVLDYIKAYSGGTDLTDGYNAVGFGAQQFKKNGITNQLCEVVSFDNANSYGVLDNYFRDAALVIPKSLATIKSDGIVTDDFYGYSAGDKVKIPNVVLGYLNNNGENRTRMVGPVAGVNGFGYPFTDQYDDVRLFIKSEYMLIVNLANQMLKIVKEGTF